MDKSYYVYIHLEETEYVYVGKGKGGRFLQYQGRSPSHLEYMQSRFRLGDYDFAKIIKSGLSQEEALIAEGKLIRYLKPKFNIQGLPKLSEPQRIKEINPYRLLDACEGLHLKEEQENARWRRKKYPPATLNFLSCKKKWYVYVTVPRELRDFYGVSQIRKSTGSANKLEADAKLLVIEDLIHKQFAHHYTKA